MRPTVYVPILAPEEFDTFRAVLGDNIPDTYDEWRKLTENRVHQITRDGGAAVAVKIHPDEFFNVWLPKHGDHANLQGLDALAAFKGPTGNRD